MNIHKNARFAPIGRERADALLARRPFGRSDVAGGLLDRDLGHARAPISMVSASRESSVLFAAAISVLVLREPLTLWRAVAGVVIVTGIVVARAG